MIKRCDSAALSSNLWQLEEKSPDVSSVIYIANKETFATDVLGCHEHL
jgi:hypothetical protein